MSVSQRSWNHYIGGEWRPTASGQTMKVLNPATEEVIGSVQEGTADDIAAAVTAATEAAKSWRETTPGERAAMLFALADKLDENTREFAELESDNVGKPLYGHLKALEEPPWGADNLRFFAGCARALEGLSTGEYAPGLTSMIRREPIGVVGGIVPWNYPLLMAIWKLGPALATGNTIVLKPAEDTPLTLLRFAEMSQGILPAGVLNVVTGTGTGAGAPLVEHPGVGLIAFTGDVETGREVARTAAASLKRLHLELGGKAAVIVFDDADLDQAASTINRSAYHNAGQDCMASTRVIAGPKIHDSLVGELIEGAKSLRVGDPRDESTQMGPLVTGRHQSRVLDFVGRATETGAEVVTGGEALGGRGYYVAPTVITGAAQTAEIIQREVFGPVVTVQRFSGEAEALSWANGVEYGLTASVFTRDIGRALRVSRALDFGTVWINTHDEPAVETPHGGFKSSGYGKDMSKYAVEDYTRIKLVAASLT